MLGVPRTKNTVCFIHSAMYKKYPFWVFVNIISLLFLVFTLYLKFAVEIVFLGLSQSPCTRVPPAHKKATVSSREVQSCDHRFDRDDDGLYGIALLQDSLFTVVDQRRVGYVSVVRVFYELLIASIDLFVYRNLFVDGNVINSVYSVAPTARCPRRRSLRICALVGERVWYFYTWAAYVCFVWSLCKYSMFPATHLTLFAKIEMCSSPSIAASRIDYCWARRSLGP